MSDKACVLLVTRDEALARTVEQRRPPQARLVTRTPDALTALPESVQQCWVDLDAGDDVRLPACARYVYFHSALSRPPRHLPPGIFVRKPLPSSALDVLWAEPAAARTPAGSAQRALPAWLLDFQELHLPTLCRKCVEWLPQFLGYRYTSLYLADHDRKLLTLAGSNHQHAIALAVSLEAAPESLLASVALSGELLETADVSQELLLRGLPRRAEPVEYPDQACLVAPLVSGGKLRGVLNCAGRLPDATPPTPLDAICLFLARTLQHAQEFERARTEARVDGLTGLYNYRWMSEALELEIQRAERFGTPLTVIMLDLDGLKEVNDQRGHAAGDRLLRHMAGQVRSGLRRFDTAARIGGDEFVLLLPSTGLPGAEQVAQRILRGMQTDTLVFGGTRMPITASIGVAEWQTPWSAAELLAAADQAMYTAKRRGRNAVEIYLAPPRAVGARLRGLVAAATAEAQLAAREVEQAMQADHPAPQAMIVEDPGRSG